MTILGNTPEFKPSEVVVAEEVIDGYLYHPGGAGFYILVAEVSTTVVGYICFGPTPLTDGTWDIYWEAVAREQQGQGIGSTLIKSAEEEMGKARVRLIMIETSSTPEYEKTRRFYLGHSYEVVCRIADFYAPGDDKLILQKRLQK